MIQLNSGIAHFRGLVEIMLYTEVLYIANRVSDSGRARERRS